MGIFFQPDMKTAKQLSAAATRHVLRIGPSDQHDAADLRETVPVDFLRSITELPAQGTVLTTPSPL